MARKSFTAIGVVLLFLAALAASQAAEYSDLYITVRKLENNQLVAAQPVSMEFTNVNTGTTINLTEFANRQGIINYRISIGNWKLVMSLDAPETPEMDYAAERTFLVEEFRPSANMTVYLAPVGAVEGSVANPSGKLVNGADVTFKCRSHSSSTKTDQFGTFKKELLPVGECKVQAAYEGMVGSTTANVTQGELNEVTVRLNKSILYSTRQYLYAVLGLIVVGGGIFAGYRIFRRRKKKEKRTEQDRRRRKKGKPGKAPPKEAGKSADEGSEGEKEGLNPRARDIMKTLNDREGKIVEFLLSQDDRKSTQATIRNSTGIPKTSLARIFQSLENKRVIEIEKIGKLKKIRLTDWFLGKEKS